MSLTGIFAIGVSGVSAFSSSLSATASNIANSQTVGYKRVQTDFSDLLPSSGAPARSPVSSGVSGAGVSANNRQLVSQQGALVQSATTTNLAIAGDGLFVVARAAQPTTGDGGFLFTRAGDFAANAQGDLVNSGGFFLQGAPTGDSGEAPIGGALTGLQTVNISRLPDGVDAAALGDLTAIEIDPQGFVIESFSSGESRTLYRIPIALFANPDALQEAEATAFRASTAAGQPRLVGAGVAEAGSISGASLEQSTVDIGSEFSTLIQTQRAYATNARILSVADELWSRLNETAA